MRFICFMLLLTVSCKKQADIKIPEAESESSPEESSGEESSADGSIEDGTEEETIADEGEEETSSETTDPKEVKPDPTELAKAAKTAMMVLDNTNLELPCKDYLSTKFDCTTTTDVERSLVVGGDSATVYEVELRVRGVTEPMSYSGGSLDGKYFYTGGIPNNPTFNIFKITTENPKQVYYLNFQPTVGGYVFSLDYTAKIKVSGSSTVKFFASAQNGTIISNNASIVVPEITKSPEVVQGQFVQINVLSAKPL